MATKADTKDRILRHIRSTNEPAVSAAQLADELEVSVHTVNKHVDNLVDEGSVQTTQIGNAKAYYIPFTELPNHAKPDHTCARCGRDIRDLDDFAKIQVDRYYQPGRAPEEPDFYIFCRFCNRDFVHWVYDESQIGDYYDVHSWSIPRDQLEEVRNDPDIRTAPETLEHLSDEEKQVYSVIKEIQEEDGWVTEGETMTRLTEVHGMHEDAAENALKQLSIQGQIEKDYETFPPRYRTAE